MEELRQRDRERYLLGAPPGPMSLNELRRLYGMEPVEMTAFGDTERKWLMPPIPQEALNYSYSATTGNSTISTSGNVYYPMVSDQTYGYKYQNGQIVPYPIQISAPSSDTLVEAAPRRETPEAWLRRRVAEICWTPT